MDIRNCIKCRHVFNYINSPYCPMCEKEEERIFESVRIFIKENPLAKMSDIVEQTGVSIKKITRYIKEGRLEISKGLHGVLTCDSCGVPIFKGKYCDSCVIKISHDLELTPNINKVAKMHTRQR